MPGEQLEVSRYVHWCPWIPTTRPNAGEAGAVMRPGLSRLCIWGGTEEQDGRGQAAGAAFQQWARGGASCLSSEGMRKTTFDFLVKHSGECLTRLSCGTL